MKVKFWVSCGTQDRAKEVHTVPPEVVEKGEKAVQEWCYGLITDLIANEVDAGWHPVEPGDDLSEWEEIE